MSLHSNEARHLCTNQISLTYLNPWLIYNHFRFGKKQTSAILNFFFWLRLRPYHSNRRAIPYQTVKFRQNRATRGGVMTSYTISRWRLRRLHTTSGFVLVDVIVIGRSSSLPENQMSSKSDYLRRSNITFNFDFDHITAVCTVPLSWIVQRWLYLKISLEQCNIFGIMPDAPVVYRPVPYIFRKLFSRATFPSQAVSK